MLRGNLSTNLNKAIAECDLCNCLRRVSGFAEQSILHFTMDFAEKILLASPIKKPRKLRIITGLKVDLLSISCSNNGNNYVFCSTEGFLPDGNSASEVVSIVVHVI